MKNDRRLSRISNVACTVTNIKPIGCMDFPRQANRFWCDMIYLPLQSSSTDPN